MHVLKLLLVFASIAASLFSFAGNAPPALDGVFLGDFCLNPEPRSCSFYASCLEIAYPCGENGYALGYGDRYCNKFRQLDGKLSPKGIAWRDSTMLCLQRSLVPFFAKKRTPENCEAITDFAFASHSFCYTQPGASICALDPFGDLPVVFKTIESDDILSRRGAEQTLKVVRTCLTHATDPRLLPRSLENAEARERKIKFWQFQSKRYQRLLSHKNDSPRR